jgi:flagellar hook-associated protein 2
MAAFTSMGIGSGLDVNSMVSQLVALERKPIDLMKVEANKLQTKVSSFGKIQSLASALQDASNALASNTLWTQAAAKSADAGIVAATATNGAQPGNYAVSVQALAASQNLVTPTAFAAATDLVGSGTLTIQVGSWDSDGTMFEPEPDLMSVDIAIVAGDTLETLRDKINAADAGATASIVTDANGARLAIRASETGVENGFRITVADSDGNGGDAAGLSRFAYDPSTGASQLQRTQAAANAQATINGIQVDSASNTLNGTIDGLNLQLLKVSDGDVDVSVVQDKEALDTAIRGFVTAYNELAKYVAEQTKYDEASKTGGILQGDSTALGIQGKLRAILNAPSGASSVFGRLSDIGLQVQRDGTLQVNESKLSEALSNPKELKKALANYDLADANNNGFAKRYAMLADAMLSVDGIITTRSESLRRQIDANEDKQDRMSDRVALFEQRLIAQYTAMDANMARLNSLSAFMTQQIAALTASNKNNG